MNSMIKAIAQVLFINLFVLSVFAQEGIAYKQLGKVSPRHANQIASSNFSIGGETMDRDLLNFESWKEYLGPLGAKKIRLQAGWAKCEPQKGVYNFEWLDEIVDYCLSQGVEPWLQTAYGNPIYNGGGGIHLSAGIPNSQEALRAWDNWVSALAKRYAGRVKYWEIWNEPDNGKTKVEDYAALYTRSAQIIRQSIPDATLYALSLAVNLRYASDFMELMHNQGKLHLIDAVSMHGYTYNPISIYVEYQKLYRIIRQYSDEIELIQGELGCPSENQSIYALKDYDWNELSQSKWVLRKMMGDLGRDIPSNYFLIIDIVYTHDHDKLMPKPMRNTKGLIESDLERNFIKLKPSYFAYQHTTSIFDNTLERIPNYVYQVNSETSLSVFAYRSKLFDKQAVTIWKDKETPTTSNKKTNLTFEFPQGMFDEPVYVDLRTGKIFEIPASDWEKNGTNYTFKNVPIYDSPILIADKSLIQIELDNNLKEAPSSVKKLNK